MAVGRERPSDDPAPARRPARLRRLARDTGLGFTGMDVETAVRERIPVPSILPNTVSMAMDLPMMPRSTEKSRATDISRDLAAFARAIGGHGERITDPAETVPAIRRGIAATEAGQPALPEFITAKETEASRDPVPGTADHA